MANDGFFAQKWNEVSDKLQDQVWYQQIRSKWDELDPKNRSIIRTGSMVLAITVLLVGTVSLYSDVRRKRQQIEDRQELVTKLQKSQDELRRLRENSPLAQGNPDEPWNTYIESKLAPIGIRADSITVEPERALPVDKNNPDRPKETVIDATLKKVNVRQLVKLVYQLENGGRPAKVKRIQVDTEPDESGYLNLSITLLGYRK